MKLHPAIFLITLFGLSFTVTAQKKVDPNNQVWVGYMTSGKISERYSLWNDFHYVPESFGIIRTGFTRHLSTTAAVTAGYAYLWLSPKTGVTELNRNEHRPWGQLQLNLPVAETWSFTHRLRYDARFRENVSNGEITEGYTFNHRVRILLSIKKTIGNNPERKLTPYLSLSNETLLNFGNEVVTTFDQNRLSLSFGLQRKQIQYQIGYMNRFVQTGPSNYTLNRTLVFWVIQKFDFKKIVSKFGHHEPVHE
jgi:hypothetical protein